MATVSSSYRSYFTVAREMSPGDWYVDNREARQYSSSSKAQCDADSRNETLIPENTVNKFVVVEVTRSVEIKKVS